MFKNIEEKLEDDAKASGSEGEYINRRWDSPAEFNPIEFRRLYDSAFTVLFRVAFRITNSREAAEDLCQDSFFRLYEKNMVFQILRRQNTGLFVL